MTDREAQIEALWTYEISTEKVLRRAVKKGFITQAEAEEFSEKLFEQLDTKKIPGFLPSSLGEKMRAEQVNVNPYVSMTEIAKEKKSSSSGYLNTELDEEQHHNRILADVGENLQPQISRGRLR